MEKGDRKYWVNITLFWVGYRRKQAYVFGNYFITRVYFEIQAKVIVYIEKDKLSRLCRGDKEKNH